MKCGTRNSECGFLRSHRLTRICADETPLSRQRGFVVIARCSMLDGSRSLPYLVDCSLLTAHRSQHENSQILERGPDLLRCRSRGGEVLEGTSDRSASDGRRPGGDRPDRVHHHHHPVRSADAGAPQTPGPFPISQLPKHDETMDCGKIGEGVARLRDCQKITYANLMCGTAAPGCVFPRCTAGGGCATFLHTVSWLSRYKSNNKSWL